MPLNKILTERNEARRAAAAARTEQAARAAHQEPFDWDRAIAGLRRMLDGLG